MNNFSRHPLVARARADHAGFVRFRALSFLLPGLLFAALALLFAPRFFATPTASVSGPLAHEAYVWQRVHHSGVQTAIREHGPAFRQLTVLAAELSWPSASAAPEVVRIPLKLPPPDVFAPGFLTSLPALGLALRVHTYRGSFAPDAPATLRLVATAREVIATAEADGYRVAELQLDFDAAESQLDAYREWITALRAAVAPVPVAFTALPAWLDHPRAFARLARSADSYLLQVHSLVLPASPADLAPLCDPFAARRAVRLAARIGVPFRLALPTYGYEVAFDPRGRRLGVAADGSARAWPPGATIRVVRSDAAALAALVSSFKRQRPAALVGLAWYRLPVPGERLNWPWPTLACVMQGRAPAARLVATSAPAPASPALFRVALANSGEADATPPRAPALLLRWSGARRLAADTHHGFAFETETAETLLVRARPGFRLSPHATQPVAWLRFDQAPATFHATLLPE